MKSYRIIEDGDMKEYSMALPTSSPQSVDEKIEQRRVKEKTRPCQSAIFEIIQIPEAPKEEPI